MSRSERPPPLVSSSQRHGGVVRNVIRHAAEPTGDQLETRMRQGAPYRTYHTGLVIPFHEPGPKPPFYGPRWMLTYHKRTGQSQAFRGNEILIHASNWNAAQKVLSSILAALQAYQGDPAVLEVSLVAWNAAEPDNFRLREHAKTNGYTTTHIPFACSLVARASRNSKYVYALSKYQRSIAMFSILSVDLEPGEYIRPSPLPEDQNIYAQSIVLAYGVIEDLGLEVRASRSKPSMINGSWNPTVLQDLESRLLKGNVNIKEPFSWVIRGPKRKTESLRPLPIVAKESWASGLVRDSQVNVVDAIARASWLRSHVAAHKTRQIIRSLSPYDVRNVQDLARRLLLETLGFWEELG